MESGDTLVDEDCQHLLKLARKHVPNLDDQQFLQQDSPAAELLLQKAYTQS